MATRNTPYRIGAPSASAGKPIWIWIVNEPRAGAEWHWTGDVKRASRWAGRTAARAFADRAEAWMRRNGHDVTLYLVPATGGVPVGGGPSRS